MKRNQRREILKTAAMLVAGGAAASAGHASAQTQVRTPFVVPQTFIPIAGTGLVRAYARAHRGDVRYEPREPHGARFVVDLPSVETV